MAKRGGSNLRPHSAGLALIIGLLAACSAQIPLPSHPTFNGGSVGVPLNRNFGPVSHSGPTGVPLPPPTTFSNHGTVGVPLSNGRLHPSTFSPTFGSSFSPPVGIPLSTAAGNTRGPTTVFTAGGSRVGVPLVPTTGGGRFTTFGVSDPVIFPNVGRGIQDTKPQGNFAGGFRGIGAGGFHINELPTSIELDKNLSPVPPYFVFSDEDSSERTLSIGGPKTGGLLPIANPTGDPKLLRLLSQPIVRQRLVAEAQTDRALKISAILMAHRQVVGGQITYASLKVGETNCPANRLNSLRGCNIDITEDSYICEVAFWERPWLNATRILDEKTGCAETETESEFDEESDRSVGSLRGVVEGEDVGGVWAQSPSLPSGLTGQQLAVEAFDYVDAHSDSNFRGYLAGHSVHSVLVDRARNLTKVQVWVDYGFTLCLKLDWTQGGQKDPRNCPIDTSRVRYSCALTLLYHPSQLMPLRVVHGDDKDELKCTKKPISQSTGPGPAIGGNVPAGFAKELQTCPGCPAQAALSDPAIMSILEFAMEEYDHLYSDDRNIHKPVSLLKAYTQATAGTKYVLTVEVAETLCLKGVAGVKRSQCARDPTEENEICLFIVLHQPWLPSSHLLSAKCFDMEEGHRLNQNILLSPATTAGIPISQSPGRPLTHVHPSNVGVPLPPVSNTLKPVPLLFGYTSNRTGPPVLDAQARKIVQFIIDQVNAQELHDDLDSRDLDDSREYDDSVEYGDDSMEYGGYGDSDGYYQLVKVHQVVPLSGAGQQRFVLELGETNCSRSFLPGPSRAYCALDPFEEHEVCDAIVSTSGPHMRLVAVSCEDLGDYLGQSSLVPPVPSVTWVPAPFLPVGHLGAASRPITATGFSSTITGQYSNMQSVSPTTPSVRKAGELVVARYNLLSGEDELARLAGILTAHTLTTPNGGQRYLLEVEMAETICKKYLPIIDQSKCPVDPTEEKIVCQAEVQRSNQANVHQHHSQQQAAWDGLSVNKLYCRDRDDYITARSTGEDGPWTAMSPSSPKLKQLATFTADQYDIRSDDDDLFVLHRIVSAKYQNVSGIRYDIVVELAETVCPKYKEHINKARCRKDLSEDIKLCNAKLFEPPSGVSTVRLTKLQCKDKPDPRHPGVHHSHEDHSSEILVLPSVHPSAHARPVFLNKFKKQRFRVRLDDSGESLESNEQFYAHPRTPGSSRRGHLHDDSHSVEDSDEFLPRWRRSLSRRRRAPVLAVAAADAHSQKAGQ